MTRKRAVCFTLNNYTEQDVLAINSLHDPDFQYVCYGKEVGESGTPHLQGYVYATNANTFSWFCARLPRCHCEFAKGSPDQAISYCFKDGDTYEWGTRPMSQKRKGEAEIERYARARELARAGDFESVDADIYIRCYRTLKEIRKDHMVKPPDLESLPGVWIYGRAGIGKSRKARADYPDAYFKMANKWWDGYQNESNVILDDLDKKHDVLGHHLKIWMDRYAFIAETKGCAILIRPAFFVVTSQYSIDEIWDDEATREAIKRRCKIIHMDTL